MGPVPNRVLLHVFEVLLVPRLRLCLRRGEGRVDGIRHRLAATGPGKRRRERGKGGGRQADEEGEG